ncbi:hypothetical protein AS850_14420 [Frondihabitans sp. 762G35]|uniref:DMP19 family protein n=1 Tax=Frondihabitans sp. 762G35 TaxID=1446794 RepID=UPI000D1FDC29|nr:DUF4375 domain-containing protein [Frondihabitans sp. 762G35]ARC58277.1 hypothetical protein AS850_14420 [Frondihabitans sp. 762G35]
MSTDIEEAIWDRAELRAGGDAPEAGDQALSALLRVHAEVSSSGFEDALKTLTRSDLEEGAEGFEFFGALAVRDLVLEASDLDVVPDDEDDDAPTADEVDERLDALDDRYAELVPSESALTALVATRYRDHPDDFAPVG